MTTFTPSLRLWQGTPFDVSIRGAWGGPLNVNDNLLEAAILGTSAIVLTGQASPFTVPTASGAADAARSLIQQFTGALTGNMTVILPNVPKVGYFRNSTTGGFILTINAGAGTSATIPADGQWHFYWTDGATNLVLPSVVFGTGIAGPIIGTTGTFSGAVSMAALTATSGHFASTLQVDGTSALNGQVTLNSGALLPNNVALQVRDGGGVARNLLYESGNTTVFVNAGGGSIQIDNQAQSVALVQINDAGAVTLAGPLSTPSLSTSSLSTGAISGTSLAVSGAISGANITVPGAANAATLNASGNAFAQNFLSVINGGGLYGRDTGNVQRVMMTIDGANCTNIFNAGAVRTRILSQSGSAELFGVDNGGDCFFGPTISTSPISAGGNGACWRPTAGWDINCQGSAATMSLGNNVGALMNFFPGNGGLSPVGSITTNGVGTFYNSASDQRLKLDDGMIEGHAATWLLMKLRPRWFRWKSKPDADSEPGFFAQQVNRVWPWAVTRARRRKDTWMLDNSKLVPLLTASLQDAHKQIAALDRRLRAIS